MTLITDHFSLLFLVFWILWTLFFIFNVMIFFRKKKSFYIQSRSPNLILISAFGQFLMYSHMCFQIIIGPKYYPNAICHWFLWLVIPFHFLPYPLRSIRFMIERKSYDNPKIAEYRKYYSDSSFCIYFAILTGISFIWGLIRYIIIEENHWGNYGHGTTKVFYRNALILLAIAVIALGIGVFMLKDLHDEIWVASEFKSILFIWVLLIGPFLGFGFLYIQSNNTIYSLISPMFGIAACVSSFLVTFGVPVHLSMVRPEIIDLGEGAFKDIDSALNDKEVCQLFEKYAKSNLFYLSVDFIKSVDSYRKLTDPDEINTEFHKIMNKFIHNQEFNIEDGPKKSRLMNVTKPNADSFSEVYLDIKSMISPNLSNFNMHPEAKALQRQKERRAFRNAVQNQ